MFQPDQSKDAWERGKDALEILMQNFPVESLEKLAVVVSKKPEAVPQLSMMLQQIDELI